MRAECNPRRIFSEANLTEWIVLEVSSNRPCCEIEGVLIPLRAACTTSSRGRIVVYNYFFGLAAHLFVCFTIDLGIDSDDLAWATLTAGIFAAEKNSGFRYSKRSIAYTDFLPDGFVSVRHATLSAVLDLSQGIADRAATTLIINCPTGTDGGTASRQERVARSSSISVHDCFLPCRLAEHGPADGEQSSRQDGQLCETSHRARITGIDGLISVVGRREREGQQRCVRSCLTFLFRASSFQLKRRDRSKLSKGTLLGPIAIIALYR